MDTFISVWQRCSPRERRLLALGALALALLAGYALFWQPWQTRLHDARAAVQQLRADLAWMRGAAVTLQRLGPATPAPNTPAAKPAAGSLAVLVDSSAAALGLADVVKRVEPQSDGRLRVVLEQVGFDRLLLWLGRLRAEHGVVVEQATINRDGGQAGGRAEGRANARLILRDGARDS